MDGLCAGLAGLLLLAGLLSAAERMDPEDRDLDDRAPGRRRCGPTRVDAAWFAVYLAYAPLTAWAVTALVGALSGHGVARAAIQRMPGPAAFGAAVLSVECTAYWLHRTMHARPALWRMHAVHHGATDLHWWSAFRFHPVDGVLAYALPLVAAATLGFPPATLAAYVALTFVVTVFAHADVWVPGAWLERVVAVPGFHRTHHEVGRDANFALVLPAFDHLFGTAAGATSPRRFGLAPDTDQRRIRRPSVSDARFATQLTESAPSGSDRPRRQTNTASR